MIDTCLFKFVQVLQSASIASQVTKTVTSIFRRWHLTSLRRLSTTLRMLSTCWTAHTGQIPWLTFSGSSPKRSEFAHRLTNWTQSHDGKTGLQSLEYAFWGWVSGQLRSFIPAGIPATMYYLIHSSKKMFQKMEAPGSYLALDNGLFCKSASNLWSLVQSCTCRIGCPLKETIPKTEADLTEMVYCNHCVYTVFLFAVLWPICLQKGMLVETQFISPRKRLVA